MSMPELIEVEGLSSISADVPDDLFVCCASFEERCLGAARLLREYRCKASLIFVYDEPDERREEHLRELQQRLQACGPVALIATEEVNPIPAMRRLGEKIRQVGDGGRPERITVDVTTFTKRHLLLLLRTLDGWGAWDTVRLVYTEPRDYIASLDQPLSYGIREVETIATFEGRYDPARELLLLMMLGYDGDRSMALWQEIAPHHTAIVIPRPAYHPEWQGRTEEMNASIIALVGSAAVRYADSRNPMRVADELEGILSEPQWSADRFNQYVAPLGTKPQAIGLYLYVRRNPNIVRVIYAPPLRHNQDYFSTGVGRTWVLPH